MKRFLLWCALFFFGWVSAQQLRPVPQKIADYHAQNKSFKKISLFTEDKTASKISAYQKDARDASVMQVKKAELKNIINDKPEFLELTFPFEGGEIAVELYKVNIFTQDFLVNTDKGKVNYRPGVYYQGIIKGDMESVAAFSFFDNEVMGVSSQEKNGNIVLGKAKDSEDYVSYSDMKMTGNNPFICNADEIMENQKQKFSYDPAKGNVNKMTENCVRVYYEVCYKPYQNNSSNTTTTTNWLTGVHNNIATLYNNDNVKVALSEVFIWTSADPYTGTYSQNLAAFRTNRPTFNGDLAHLVNSPSTTSVAYLNSLCTTYKHAYSGINQTYAQVPAYSWTIMAMTHEMGHSLGSPHTHACAWNGNDTAIDGCGPASGNSEGCTAPLPENKGTIMSYCHLISSVGINLANGFGPQPGALIRATVDSKGCLGSDCVSSCLITVTNMNLSNVTANSATITIVDNSASSWKYRVEEMDGTVAASGTTTNKTFNVTGLQAGKYYVIKVGTDCGSAQAFQKEQVLLTDADWCSGVVFTDSGGETGNYMDGENFIKTFYPANPGEKLTLTFTDFDLESGYDYLYVYNGINTAAPLFSNGGNLSGNTIPGPFTSTHSSGAITVRFRSDEGLTMPGWKANFSCAVLATDQVKGSSSIKVSPNPTRNFVTVSGIDKVLGVKVYDAAGKLVKAENNLNLREAKVDLSSYPAGNYLISITTEKETITKQVIKK